MDTAKDPNDPELAYTAVRAAVLNGRLIPQPCVVCWALPTEAHHPRGYSESHQLDIVWLCARCHEQIHGRTGASDRAGALRPLRLEHGLSLSQVAKTAGLNKGRLSVIERGVTPTQAETNAIMAAIDQLRAES